MSDLLATKPLDLLLAEAHDESETCLRRVLGPVNLVTLGIGAIIGAGIFVLTGTMLSLPWSTWLRLIVWLIVGMGIYFGYGRSHSRLRRAAEAR